MLENGKPEFVEIEATEKIYSDYLLTATDPGGHSSLPTPDNAIYHVADALGRLEKSPFPFELNAVTRAYFEKLSTIVHGQEAEDMKAILREPPDQAAIDRLSKDPLYNSTMRTTCVATRLAAGHANNALPQNAQATVNCRILPGHSPAEVRAELIRIFDDPKVQVSYIESGIHRSPDETGFKPVSPPPYIMKPLERLADEMWNGASDSVYTIAAGIPSCGVSGIAVDHDDIRAHGKDERLRVGSYYDGVEFFYRYLKALTD